MAERAAKAGLTAGEVHGEERPHEGPAQARPVGDGRVDVGGAGRTREQQVEGLAQQRTPAAGWRCGPAPRALDPDRPLAVGVVEGERPFHRFGLGAAAAHHLDQRNEMRRVEGMADDEARAVPHALLQGADEEARRARREHRVRAERRVDPAVERALERLVLRRVLLHEDGRLPPAFAGSSTTRTCAGSAPGASPSRSIVGQAASMKARSRASASAAGSQAVTAEAAREEVRRPACADGPGAEQCDGVDCRRCGPCHGCLPDLSGEPSACRCRRAYYIVHSQRARGAGHTPRARGARGTLPRARSARHMPSVPGDRGIGAGRRAAGGGHHGGQGGEDGRGMARGADRGAVLRDPDEGHGAALHGRLLRREGVGRLCLRLLRRRPLQLRRQVRFRHRVAQLHPAGRSGQCRHGGGRQLRYAPGRGGVQPLRCPSRPRLPRWAGADGSALLHELRRARAPRPATTTRASLSPSRRRSGRGRA